MTPTDRTQRRRSRCRTHPTPTGPRTRPRSTEPTPHRRRRGPCTHPKPATATTAETVPPGVEWLTPTQAARYVQLPARQLQQWRYLKKGPPYSLAGRAVRYRRADLDAWLIARRVEPTETGR